MVDIWLFHPKEFLNFYTFCSKEIFWSFLATCTLEKEPWALQAQSLLLGKKEN
jgi:hypothetical protein